MTDYQRRAFDDDTPEAARYRELYEGSQRSLRDMTVRQSEAIERTISVRRTIGLICQQANPVLTAAFEDRLGTRVDEAADEALLALLDEVILRLEDRQGRMDLAAALARLGQPGVNPASPSAMAAQVTARLDAAPPADVPAGLGELFEGSEDAPIVQVAGSAAAPVAATPEATADPTLSVRKAKTEKRIARRAGEAAESLADLFDGGMPADEEPPFPIEEPADEFYDEPSDECFEDAHLPEEVPAQEVPAQPQVVLPPLPDDMDPFGDGSAPKRVDRQVPLSPRPVSAGPAPKAKKAVRRKATPAAATLLDDAADSAPVAADAAEGGVDAVTTRLATPAPVFHADLVDMLGSISAADAWVAEQINGKTFDVQFIDAGRRNDQLGQLVSPLQLLSDAGDTWKDIPWGRAMAAYRGVGLHLAGTVVRHVGGAVVADLSGGADVLDLRIRKANGLVAVVTAVSDDTGALVAAVGRALGERLAQLVVLAADTKALAAAEAAITKAAIDNGWDAPMPVVAHEVDNWTSGRGAGNVLLGA
ncbi:MAG: hypothetical protein GY882_12900 [Actinomycetia bacterium]|nr:hypothetical protein [Actinomycetes bacterium]MCP4843475.1 hypothetical protein [Actinomycetes bacterium]